MISCAISRIGVRRCRLVRRIWRYACSSVQWWLAWSSPLARSRSLRSASLRESSSTSLSSFTRAVECASRAPIGRLRLRRKAASRGCQAAGERRQILAMPTTSPPSSKGMEAAAWKVVSAEVSGMVELVGAEGVPLAGDLAGRSFHQVQIAARNLPGQRSGKLVYPPAAINRARGVVGAVQGFYNIIRGLANLNVASATLANPRQLEAVLLSRNAGNIGQVANRFTTVYQAIPPPTDAPPAVRDLIDMTDATAQAAFK